MKDITQADHQWVSREEFIVRKNVQASYPFARSILDDAYAEDFGNENDNNSHALSEI